MATETSKKMTKAAKETQDPAKRQNLRLKQERTKSPDDMAASERAVTRAQKRPASKPATRPVPTAPPQQVVKGRIAVAVKDDPELPKLVKALATSTGHIAFNRNGSLNEVYFRAHNGSPAVWKAPIAAPVADAGYRVQDAVVITTGANAIKDLVKRLTGRSPGQIGITLRERAKVAGSKRVREGMTGLDAAVKVLSESKAPLTCPEIIDLMKSKGFWSSPKGKTPAATLSSAIGREIKAKGADARFQKADCGRFVLAGK